MPEFADSSQAMLSYFTVERALASIFWMDKSGMIHHANQTACDHYGYSKEEFAGMSLFDLNRNFNPDNFPVIWNRIEKEKRFSLESTHWKKDGTEIPVEIFVNYIEFEGVAYNCSFVLNISERKRKEKLLHSVSQGTASAFGQDFFKVLVTQIANALDVKYVIVTECANNLKTRLRTLAYVKDMEISENVEYDTEGTPCRVIMESGEDFYQKLRVEEDFEKEEGIEGYYGVPIKSSEGDTIGHIALLNDHELSVTDEEKDILSIFADRAGVEIERKIANERLVNALDEVEQLKDRLEAENTYLQQEIKLEHNFEEIISQSPRFKKVLGQVEQVASTDATVLVLGESGTGKELLARAIHNISNRKERPLVKVNCAALPANLIESELFGHEKGAFTGAVARKTGRFELADGGTLFLDEVGELPLEVQSKLLRALQEGEIERVGGSSTINVDVRIIAATNRHLEGEVEEGNFRPDLFYRLNVFPIQSIPLRERKEDIGLLVRHFADKFGTKIGKRITTIPKRAINSLRDYNWPGNIRELENVIERAVILSPSNKLELGDWIPKKVIKEKKASFQTLESYERDYILTVLQETSWRVSGPKGAANILGMKPTTLESRMKKLGIERGSEQFA